MGRKQDRPLNRFGDYKPSIVPGPWDKKGERFTPRAACVVFVNGELTMLNSHALPVNDPDEIGLDDDRE